MDLDREMYDAHNAHYIYTALLALFRDTIIKLRAIRYIIPDTSDRKVHFNAEKVLSTDIV